MMQLRCLVEDPSQIAEVRREGVAMATALGFDDKRVATVALALTETSTNLWKHAKRGVVLLRPLERASQAGIEVLSLDHGAGMANVAASMRDGHSTAGSPGTGLGTLSRITTDLQIYSQAGKGTVLRYEMWAGTAPAVAGSLAIGAICVAMKGETVNGDDWLVIEDKRRHAVVVVDGLGHGPEAASATASAKQAALTTGPAAGACVMLQAIHDALKSTRGAAAAVAILDPYQGTGAFCGVGNISCLIQTGEQARHLVSHNGILGHQVSRLQEFSFPFPSQALFIAHSDGVRTHWDLQDYAGLAMRHPALITAAVYRDHERGRDDATIIVVRNTRTEY